MEQLAVGAHYVGQRLCYDDALCTVRYIGEVAGTQGPWLGVEWDDPSRGKHGGEHKGTRYFECRSKAPSVASFVRPSRPAQAAVSFLAALRAKYCMWDDEMKQSATIVRISNSKFVEEYGYDKISRRQARLEEQRLIVLDGKRVAIGRGGGEGGWNGDDCAQVEKTCPAVVDLDLSRNLLEEFEGVVQVCRGLKHLRTLKLCGNRFRTLLRPTPGGAAVTTQQAFEKITELGLEETLLSWREISHVADAFPALTHLNIGANQFDNLATTVDFGGNLGSRLTSINLEFNEFASLSDLSSLAALSSLQTLVLKGNNITRIASDGKGHPVFSSSVRFVDLSYNQVCLWSFVDALSTVFPGLTGLRISHNPIYDDPGGASSGDTHAGGGAPATDEAFMITVGRLGSLTSLNKGPVLASDRANAEMFYLSRIARQLATAPESAEADILTAHPRYQELCDLYGAPDIARRVETNPEFLEARLVNVTFRLAGDAGEYQEKSAAIPKSFDIYAVNGTR